MSHVFSKVSPQVWESGRFRSLPDDSSRLLYLYLLSSVHQNSIGVYRLPAAYACEDLGWDRPVYDEALTALVDVELVEIDEVTQEVLILRWFRHNPPTNDKHLAGVERLIGKIASQALRERADAELGTVFAAGAPYRRSGPSNDPWSLGAGPPSTTTRARNLAGSR